MRESLDKFALVFEFVPEPIAVGTELAAAAYLVCGVPIWMSFECLARTRRGSGSPMLVPVPPIYHERVLSSCIVLNVWRTVT